MRLSREAATAQGVSHLVQFLQQDLYEADLTKATVIALYISPGVMTRLKPRLLTLKPGTRVVSHNFTLDEWEPDELIRVENRNGYLWIVPANVRGTWTVRRGNDSFKVRIEQVRQELRTTGQRGGSQIHVIGARLRGTEITFSSFDDDGGSRSYSGRVDGGTMAGESVGQDFKTLNWLATRD